MSAAPGDLARAISRGRVGARPGAWAGIIALCLYSFTAGCDLLSGLSNLKIDEGVGGGGGGGGGGDGGTTSSAGGTSSSGPTCGDGEANGLETDRDCGGPDCPPCEGGFKCALARDCTTEICNGPSENEVCVKATRVAVGNAHACAVLEDGDLYCWGANGAGQLGDGTTNDSATPVRVDVSNVVEVVAGGPPDDKATAHTCALASEGTMKCWGANGSGQLGLGTMVDQGVPASVDEVSGVVQIAAGGAFTCAVQDDNRLFCWGSDAFGELADAGGPPKVDPTELTEVMGTMAIATGARHVCARLADGSLACWGDNERGQAANEALGVSKIDPVTLPAMGLATAVFAGHDFSCATDTTALHCWGDNSDATLAGQSPETFTSAPVTLPLTDVATLALGADGDTGSQNAGGPEGGHACALSSVGAVKCWGNNRSGQLGAGSASASESQPKDVVGLSGVVSIAAGAETTCAVLSTGGVRCWGRNDRGQLGSDTGGQPRAAPEAVVWP